MINLTVLAETRAKMIRSPWTIGDGTIDDEINAVGIVATHNAADVLIEIARAAKAYAIARTSPWNFAELNKIHDDLMNAIAKVTL